MTALRLKLISGSRWGHLDSVALKTAPESREHIIMELRTTDLDTKVLLEFLVQNLLLRINYKMELNNI